MVSAKKLANIFNVSFITILTASLSNNIFRIPNSRVVCSRINVFDLPNYDEIEPNLYLGNAKAACDPRILDYLNITHILTIDNQPLPAFITDRSDISYLYIRANDNKEQYLMCYFPATNAFIEEGIKTGGVLVHCHHGISRSATLVIAYIMQKYDTTYERALRYVRLKRSFVTPNSGFESQLHDYYEMNYRIKPHHSKFEGFHTKASKYKYKIASAMLIIALLIPLAMLI